MTTTDTHAAEIAETIRQQIGRGAFVMMGAKNLIRFNSEGQGVGLQFKIGRNAKRVQYVEIALRGDDTYSVEFFRMTALRLNKKTWVHTGGEKKQIAQFDGVYADMLKELIESNTGLYLSL